MKMLCHANDRFEANLISELLTTEGIFSRIKFDEQAKLNAGTEFGEGLQIFVNEEDLSRAAALLRENAQPPSLV